MGYVRTAFGSLAWGWVFGCFWGFPSPGPSLRQVTSQQEVPLGFGLLLARGVCMTF